MTDFRTWRRAQEIIAQGALTNSKHPDSFVKGIYPTHLIGSQGPHLVAEDGKLYLDYICGLGTNILGYRNPRVNAAVAAQMLVHGASPSLPTLTELEGGEHLKKIFPFVQSWKFLKTGSEACSAALRIARTVTGRNLVLSDGYHGWHDPFVSLTPPATGVTWQACIKKFEGLRQISENVAAVILEPVSLDASPARIAWLQELQRICKEHGTFLIFDEIITGVRYKDHSVTRAHGLSPDLICVGKAIANGFPLAAVGGPNHAMNSSYFVSSTYAGETYSLAACKATVETLLSSAAYNVNELFERGEGFCEAFNAIAPGLISIKGYGTRGAFQGDDLVQALFFQEACLAGIIFGKSWFYNFDLMNYDDHTLKACRDILGRIERGEVGLRGEMPKSPFAAKVRGH